MLLFGEGFEESSEGSRGGVLEHFEMGKALRPFGLAWFL